MDNCPSGATSTAPGSRCGVVLFTQGLDWWNRPSGITLHLGSIFAARRDIMALDASIICLANGAKFLPAFLVIARRLGMVIPNSNFTSCWNATDVGSPGRSAFTQLMFI